MESNHVVLDAIEKAYPEFNLGPVSLTFEHGRVYGLVGPNGAGKTTLLDVIGLQTRASSGAVRWRGRPIQWGDSDWKQGLVYVREAQSLYEELTVLETLNLAARLYDRWDADLAADLSRRFNLPMNKVVRHLSKGTRVKLALVAGVAHHAGVLILDEPTAGLDPTSREELQDLLRELRAVRPELCVLLSSHIFEDVEGLADGIVILRDGRVVFNETREWIASMSLYQVQPGVPVPQSPEIQLRWASRGTTWIVTSRGSSIARHLAAVEGAEESGQRGIVAALYRGMAECRV
jgi:ABC-2 type transport system ATP-binding protein